MVYPYLYLLNPVFRYLIIFPMLHMLNERYYMHYNNSIGGIYNYIYVVVYTPYKVIILQSSCRKVRGYPTTSIS